MSNSTDGNKSITGFTETLPAEQNDFNTVLRYIKNIISSNKEYMDEELRYITIQLVDVAFSVLLKYKQYDLLGIIFQFILESNAYIEVKKNIVHQLINFANNGQWDHFWDCGMSLGLPKPSIIKTVEAQAMSQIQMNEAAFYSSLRVGEAQQMSQIRINEDFQKKLNTANVQLRLREEKHKQDLQFDADAKKIKEEESRSQTTITPDIVTIDYRELETSFIEEKWLVRITQDGESKIYYWDDDVKRYVSFETMKRLTSALRTYAYEKYGQEIKLSSNELDYVVTRMMDFSVPLLGKSKHIQPSTDKYIFFRNVYIDLKTGNDGKTRGYLLYDVRSNFHVVCLPCDFYNDFSPPVHFGELLDYVFDGDKTKQTLVYEIIGAIMTNISLKNVFIFQGVSNGGKSTLAEIIIRLFNADEVKRIGSINEIDEIKSKKDEGRIRLLYIDDAPREKWNPSTVSYLKTRSSGITNTWNPNFKIILSTNYPIMFKTEDGRDESMENRIVVVPFNKDLKTTINEDSHIGQLIQDFLYSEKLENERPRILNKALRHFIYVLNRGREFVHQYPLNECVINSGTYPSNVTHDAVAEPESKAITNIGKEKQTISDKNPHLIEFLRNTFELTDNENEFITADEVLNAIKNYIPDTNGRVNEVGAPIKAVFGEDCQWSKRKNNKTWYKIKLKTQDS